MTAPLPRLAAWLLRVSVPERWAGSVLDDFEADWQQRQARVGGVRARAAITIDAAAVAAGFARERCASAAAAVRRDVIDAGRSVWRRPRHALATGVVIAAGVGINTAAFAVVDRVLLQPLPYDDPASLVQLAGRDEHGRSTRTVSSVDIEDWQAALAPVATIVAYQVQPVSVQAGSGFPESMPAARVTPNLFAVLGRAPIVGQDFTSRDGRLGMPGAAIISHDLWRRRFGERATIAGERVRVDGEPFTIVGVAPPGVEFPPGVGLWLARETAGARLRDLKIEFASLQAVARLSPGIPADRVQAEIDARAGGSARPVIAVPLHEAIVGSTRRGLQLAWAAVLVLFLIACANAAALLLARAASRTSELAVRTALGASRAALIRWLAIEGSMIAGLAGLAGFGIAAGLIKVFVVAESARLPRAAGVELGTSSVLVAMVLSVAAAAATAIATGRAIHPATRVRRTEGGRLVACQLALSVLLLTGAGVTGAALFHEIQRPPGFDPRDVVVVTVQPDAALAGSIPTSAVYRPLLDRLSGIDGVESVAMADHVPPDTAGNFTPIIIEGETPVAAQRQEPVRVIGVTERYFSLLRIDIVHGRSMSPDEVADGRAVVVIDSRVAARLGGAPAVGRRLLISGTPYEIVGVAADSRQGAAQAPVEPTLYRPLGSGAYKQGPAIFRAQLHVLVRGSRSADALVATVKAVTADAPGLVEPLGLSRLADRLRAALAGPLLASLVFTAFAAVGLLITLLGIYGLVSTVLQRSIPGIGVRIALGASRSRIAFELLAEALGTATVGIGVGLFAAPLAAAAIVDRLGGDMPGGEVYAAIAIALLLTVAAACAAPIRRATRVDPIRTLRCE